MDEKQLQAIEARWVGEAPYRCPECNSRPHRESDIADLIAEVRRLRCCGNCRKQQYDGMDYFCDEDNCEKYSKWEAAE